MVRTREQSDATPPAAGCRMALTRPLWSQTYAGRRGGVEIALPVALHAAARPQVIGVNVVQVVPLLPAVERTAAAHHVVVDPVEYIREDNNILIRKQGEPFSAFRTAADGPEVPSAPMRTIRLPCSLSVETISSPPGPAGISALTPGSGRLFPDTPLPA